MWDTHVSGPQREPFKHSSAAHRGISGISGGASPLYDRAATIRDSRANK
jgi:hypothetical protein